MNKQLKEKIQELIPEIMELDYGCVIKVLKPSEGVDKSIFAEWRLVKIIRDDNDNILSYEFFMGSLNSNFFPVNYGSTIIEKNKFEEMVASGAVEILGRPITLEDVLMTINNDYIFLKCNGMLGFFEQRDVGYFRDNKEKNIQWKLGKTLDQQDKETINFLHSIICQK